MGIKSFKVIRRYLNQNKTITIMPTNNEMTNTDLMQYIKNKVPKNENRIGPDYTYTEMLMYNDLKERHNIGPGIDSIIEVYDKLFGFGLSLSGYQFIGLVLEKSSVEDSTDDIYPFAFFMLAIGFIVSLFGALLSFCMYEFLTYVKHESNEYIVKGIIKYRTFLKLPHAILLVNTFCFALPINILIHTNLSFTYAIIFNVVSATLLAVGFPIHRVMVATEQEHTQAYIFKND